MLVNRKTLLNYSEIRSKAEITMVSLFVLFSQNYFDLIIEYYLENEREKNINCHLFNEDQLES